MRQSRTVASSTIQLGRNGLLHIHRFVNFIGIGVSDNGSKAYRNPVITKLLGKEKCESCILEPTETLWHNFPYAADRCDDRRTDGMPHSAHSIIGEG